MSLPSIPFLSQADPLPPRNVSTTTVLLVDDDPLIRKLLHTVLVRAGYLVIEACDGPCAIQIARTVPFDMLVTDFQMPGMDGFAMAEYLAESRPGLPVLLMSGALLDLLPLEQIYRRRWTFLPKPLHPKELIEAIGRCCSSAEIKHITNTGINKQVWSTES